MVTDGEHGLKLIEPQWLVCEYIQVKATLIRAQGRGPENYDFLINDIFARQATNLLCICQINN